MDDDKLISKRLSLEIEHLWWSLPAASIPAVNKLQDMFFLVATVFIQSSWRRRVFAQ